MSIVKISNIVQQVVLVILIRSTRIEGCSAYPAHPLTRPIEIQGTFLVAYSSSMALIIVPRPLSMNVACGIPTMGSPYEARSRDGGVTITTRIALNELLLGLVICVSIETRFEETINLNNQEFWKHRHVRVHAII